MRNFHLYLIILVSLGILFINEATAQKKISTFDSIYVHTATTLSALDIQKAIHVADSLLESSQNGHQKMKSLMLIATLNGRIGTIAKALSYAIQAEEIAQKNKDYEWQVRIAGFLSTTFREANLTEESKKYLDIAEKANKKTKADSPSFNIINAFIHQEKAYYRIAEEDYVAAMGELDKAEVEISKTPEIARNKIFLATNYQLFGTCLIGLKEYVYAHEKFTLALDELGEQESELRAFIYVGFAKIEMHNKSYERAYEFFKKAEAYIETSDNFNIKSSLYKGLSNYYKIVDNQKEAIRYSELYIDYAKAYSNSTETVYNQLIRQLHLEREKQAKKNYLLIGASLFLLVLVLALTLLFRNVRKKEKTQYEEIIKKIKTSEPLLYTGKAASSQNRTTRETLIMSKETEERILGKLKELEDDDFFIQKDISLSSLATRLHTNPKYLSYVINTHKGKDFNNYINELRIEFVIDKLHTHPEYLNYKLAYIAEECGFSSHSKFAAVFKNTTELSPSAFISHLKRDKGR